MFYIAFNHYSTTHNYSVSVLGPNGIYTFPLERFDRIKKSPKPLGHNFLFTSDAIIQAYYYQVLQKIGEIIPNGSEIVIINTPKGLTFEGYKVTQEIYVENHHMMHAASAYYASGYESSAIISIDGYGNEDLQYTKFISQSIWKGEGSSIEIIGKQYHQKKQIGIGMTYSLISKRVIGYEAGSCMGLASYGDAHRFKNIEIYNYGEGGEIFLHESFLEGINIGDDIGFCDDKRFIEQFKNNCFKIFGIEESYDYEDITQSLFAHMAAKLQHDTEKAMVKIAQYAYEKFPSKNLCLAGGSALNVIANTKILEETAFENIFVQPAATDDGLSLGALYLGVLERDPSMSFPKFQSASLGTKYDDQSIRNTLESYKRYIQHEYHENIENIVAEHIYNGKIIGVFNGRSEFGPRALGNRSIIADASSKEIADKVNHIKKREAWRPLAPLLLVEDLSDFFPQAKENYFMTCIAYANQKAKEQIAGTIHVDDTARYQTLKKEQNPIMYEILSEVKKIKGNSVVINTSFNTKGEPIIESAEDAIKMFLSSDLDYLMIEKYLITKDKVYGDFMFDYWENIKHKKQSLGI